MDWSTTAMAQALGSGGEMFVRTVRAAIIAAILASSARVIAEPAGNIDLNVFRPAMDSRGYLTVNASQVLGDRELAFGLGALAWGHHLLELDGDGKRYSIDDMITATLIAATGVRLGGLALELGASLPLGIMSGSRGAAPADPLVPGADHGFTVDGQGLGNIGLHLKVRLLDPHRGPRIGAAVIASAYLPTIAPRDRF